MAASSAFTDCFRHRPQRGFSFRRLEGKGFLKGASVRMFRPRRGGGEGFSRRGFEGNGFLEGGASKMFRPRPASGRGLWSASP